MLNEMTQPSRKTNSMNHRLCGARVHWVEKVVKNNEI